MTGATGIVFVLLPGANATLGSPDDESWRRNDEALHEVTLAPFLLARHELTRGQWRRLAGPQPTRWQEGERSYEEPEPIGPTHPADSMDWTEAQAWLLRYGMNLPTEAQWEHGCRAGTTTTWWPGDKAKDLAGCANVHDWTSIAQEAGFGGPAPFADGFAGIAPVGRFRANGFGLYDVHGNVWEWCRDQYGDYGQERSGDGLRPETPDANRTRVCRGGSFAGPTANARSANRSETAPTIRYDNLGVRPARLIQP